MKQESRTRTWQVAIVGAVMLLIATIVGVATANAGQNDNAGRAEPVCVGQHYSLKGNSGIGKDETPVFPADYWQANTKQEPHGDQAEIPQQR